MAPPAGPGPHSASAVPCTCGSGRPSTGHHSAFWYSLSMARASLMALHRLLQLAFLLIDVTLVNYFMLASYGASAAERSRRCRCSAWDPPLLPMALP
eukprot:13398614-Heterocapsa_arctica.AAC.1